jgi:putative hydrolase of the HAD superfamily
MVPVPADTSRLLGRPVRLISLDLDDTLVDTDGAAPARIDNVIARARELLGGKFDAEAIARAREQALNVDPQRWRLTPLLELFNPSGEPAIVRELGSAYGEPLIERLEMCEGVPETLAALRERYAVIILTGLPVDAQQAKLEKFGLHRMVDRVIGAEPGFAKPEAAAFHHACGLLGVSPERAAHVGDSPELDVKGAKEAGLIAIWRRPSLPRDWGEGWPAPDATITRLGELLEL